jgi:hypothetical protein
VQGGISMKSEKTIEIIDKNGIISFTDLVSILNQEKNFNEDSLRVMLFRCCKDGDIVSLKNGLYLSQKILSTGKMNEFVAANCMKQDSFVSFESALSFHGLIPERVVGVQSVTFQRKVSYENKLGRFEFLKIVTNPFFTGVKVMPVENKKKELKLFTFMMANPTRAMADIVFKRNLNWQGIELLTEGFRIEHFELKKFTKKDILECIQAYSEYPKVVSFLKKLKYELYLK